jgi:hypothetical protein
VDVGAVLLSLPEELDELDPDGLLVTTAAKRWVERSFSNALRPVLVTTTSSAQQERDLHTRAAAAIVLDSAIDAISGRTGGVR